MKHIWIVFAFIFLGYSESEKNKSQDIINEYQKNIFLVSSDVTVYGNFFDKNSQKTENEIFIISSGVAFQINDSILITANHVVDHEYFARTLLEKVKHSKNCRVFRIDSIRTKNTLKSNSEEIKGPKAIWAGSWFPSDTDEYLKCFDKEIVNSTDQGFDIIWSDSLIDLAKIKLNQPRKVKQIKKANICPDILLGLHGFVVSDSGLSFQIVPGKLKDPEASQFYTVSRISDVIDAYTAHPRLPWILVEMPSQLGDSGSPVFTQDWELVGITTAITRYFPHQTKTKKRLIISADYIP